MIQVNLNKRLVWRLLAVWLLLSALIGGAVYYLEISEVDHHVLELVLQDAKTFDAALMDKLNSSDPAVVDKLQRKADSLLERHYSLVDIYDLNQAHVVTAEHELESHIRAVIEPRHHQFPLDKQLHFEKITIDRALFLQVLVPLVNSQGVAVGYMEGVYEVSEETLDAIYRRIYRILILVVITLLVCSAVLYPVILQLNQRLYKFSRRMLHANLELLEVLGNAIAVRDETTNSHNYRVVLYAVRIGEAINLDGPTMRSLIAGSFLHDVGKIGIRDDVLRKPHELTDEETSHMKGHVSLGLEIVGKTEWLAGARDVIEYHHEKFDGNGYPHGLKGEDIPVIARIFAIADVFDALATERPYKEAFSFEEAMAVIKEKSGSHFDPRLVAVFEQIAVAEYARISTAEEPKLEKFLRKAIDQYFFEA